MATRWIYYYILFLVIFEAIEGDSLCPELHCNPDGPPISFPFRLKGRHPADCGCPGFDLSCTHTNKTVLELPVSVKLVISKIDYDSQELHSYDPTSCPARHLRSFNLPTSPFPFRYKHLYDFTVFNCSDYQTLDHNIACVNNNTDGFLFAVDSHSSIMKYLPSLASCTKMYNVSSVPYFMVWPKTDLIVKWSKPVGCKKHEGTQKKVVVTGAVVGSVVLGLVIIAFYHFHKSDKAEKENQRRIRRFLEDYRALKPTRYIYADIKRITNQFTEKLGQGSYGTVYKGKLSKEIAVAVKLLNNSKGKGEEFINEFRNEVGTMCKIHHVNIVRLVGYCADGFRRALVYEYLSNNTLQKFISSAEAKTNFPGWKKLQDIAIGIAKGIEYLHQGCEQRIVHLDIKPHNILLDENLNPKISDFGTAKLCSKDQSAVSMTAARGTMGYIAPEVFSRNFGNVSHKSDVYSFGMLVLEMVGGRKNVEVTGENDFQIYFPEWIYNLLEQGEDLRIDIEEEGDLNIAKKLATVGLCCIQWHPVDRPSMTFVVQMLEAAENLRVPPNPFASAAAKRSYAVPRAGRRPHQQLQVIEELE